MKNQEQREKEINGNLKWPYSSKSIGPNLNEQQVERMEQMKLCLKGLTYQETSEILECLSDQIKWMAVIG